MKSSVVIILSLFCFVANAQNGKFYIKSTQQRVDGIEMGIEPGDTLFLIAGNRDELHFKNITGTVEKPVIIINEGEKVIINSKEWYAIFFDNSIHFRLTGSGGKDKYGIEIASSGSQGLAISEFSSNCEADHLEIHDVGYAGIMAKTDPNCSRKDLRYFTMKNLSFHDNFIYETGSEGFYIGFSWFPIRPYRCEEDSILYAHEIHGIRIYNNDLRNTHAEAIQVGSSTKDVKIFDNSIKNYGKANVLWQNNGVQIGAGTTGDFFNNTIDTGAGDAVSFFGGGNNRLYNNLIINAGKSAIFHNDKEAVDGRSYQIMNNTIINPGEFGITVISSNTWTNKMYNNVVVVKNKANGILGYVDSRWYIGTNKVYENVDDAGFVNAESADFHLLPGSELIGNGTKFSWLKFDHDYNLRSTDETEDIGAFQFGEAGKVTPSFPFENEPETDLISVTLKNDGVYSFQKKSKNVDIVVYNGEGIAMEQNLVRINGENIEIDLSGKAQGIYYLAVNEDNEHIQPIRIIKK